MTRPWKRWLFRLSFAPIYVWHRLRRALGLGRDWLSEVEPGLYLAAMPTAADAAALARRGVRAVVNACDEYRGPRAAYRRHGIAQLHVPIIDFAEPTAEQVDSALAFLREHTAAGSGVLVHCKAGRGRSATLVLCWLVAERGLDPEEAQRALEAARPRVVRGLHRRAIVRELHRRRLAAPEAQDSLTRRTS